MLLLWMLDARQAVPAVVRGGGVGAEAVGPLQGRQCPSGLLRVPAVDSLQTLTSAFGRAL